MFKTCCGNHFIFVHTSRPNILLQTSYQPIDFLGEEEVNHANQPPSTISWYSGTRCGTWVPAAARAMINACNPSIRPVALALSSFRLPAESVVTTALAAHMFITG